MRVTIIFTDEPHTLPDEDDLCECGHAYWEHANFGGECLPDTEDGRCGCQGFRTAA